MNFGSPGFFESLFIASFLAVTAFSECSSQQLLQMSFQGRRKPLVNHSFTGELKGMN